jgi:ATP-dependent RNA helicase DeaD
MVFVNTKSKVEEIVSTLKKKGYKAEALHGDLKQVSRDKVMNGFKEGISHILVCTDVAARGIDVSDLEGIINFDLPQEQELYVHRIGRTGRAGREGLSITFATYSEQRKVFFIERYTRSQMTICQIPSVEEIQAKKIENFVNFLKNNSDVEINESNRPLIEQIKNLNLDTDKLISLLLSLTNFKLSDYPEIHVREEKPRQRSSRDRNERGLDRRNSRESRFEKSRRNDTRGKKDEKALRAEKGVSQEKLALNTGIDRRYMSDIENGRRNISLEIIEKLAAFFEMKVSELIQRIEQANTQTKNKHGK